MEPMMMAVVAAFSLAAPAAAMPPAPAVEPVKEEKLICKRISDRPSDRLAPRRKVCMTKAEWKEARRTQRVEMPEQRSTPSRY